MSSAPRTLGQRRAEYFSRWLHRMDETFDLSMLESHKLECDEITLCELQSLIDQHVVAGRANHFAAFAALGDAYVVQD